MMKMRPEKWRTYKPPPRLWGIPTASGQGCYGGGGGTRFQVDFVGFGGRDCSEGDAQ